MADNERFTEDGGYNKTQPLSEGYLRKGGVNPPTSQIVDRPPAPAAIPAASTPAITPSIPAGAAPLER